MYLTNDERIQLGLQGYGSDVPEEVVAAARAAAGGAEPAAPAAAAAKKRARVAKGRYRGDDQSTPEVNEAWTTDEP
ncbi:MAG: hypothetical protein VKM34_08175 [Cyanobacteriota bacterium]|nr:hypothetical protein [Cyanobacteriota bacterium]